MFDKRDDWVTSSEDIQNIFPRFYSQLFFSDGNTNAQHFDSYLLSKVNDEINELLLRNFTKLDIENAFSHMHTTKAPWPDGMHAFFYQEFWNIVGDGVSQECLKVLNER